MIISFFQNQDGQLDVNSVGAGVYIFKIGIMGNEKSFFPLYVGESYSMLARCADHIYEVSKGYGHLAIPEQYYNNDNLMLVVEVCESVEIPENLTNNKRDILLQQKEIEAIKRIKPVSQNATNDNLKDNAIEEVTKVIEKVLGEKI